MIEVTQEEFDDFLNGKVYTTILGKYTGCTFYQDKNYDKIACSDDINKIYKIKVNMEYTEQSNVIDIPLSKRDIQMKVRRRYIPVHNVVKRLLELKNPAMWKSGGIGGQDQYAGQPPAIRLIDELIESLKSQN